MISIKLSTSTAIQIADGAGLGALRGGGCLLAVLGEEVVQRVLSDDTGVVVFDLNGVVAGLGLEDQV